MALSQAIPLAVEALTALQVIHEQGLIHRDVKPANIFLTPHGVKILDFGLARPTSLSLDPALTQTATRLTQAGTMMGTPRYMSPEQIQGQSLDGRTDLFAMGATLYEMLAGTPAFAGATSLDVLHATLHDAPAALGGSRTIESVNRIVQRLLAKRPEDRPTSASAVAEDLKACLVLGNVEAVPRARTMTWLIVLPFRILRADAETDFLAFSLPDAIASSLAGLRSLGVRSTAGAARFAAGEIELRAHRLRGARRSSDDRHFAARRRGDSRDDAVGWRAGGRGVVVACRPCHAARRVSATRRSRPADRVFTLTAADGW